MARHIDVSIILPALNEEAIIAQTLQQLAAYARQHHELGSFEVVVVAAGTDATPQIAKTFADQFAALQVVTLNEAVGKGRDVRLGFQAARGDVRLFIDADLSTPLAHIGRAVELLRGGNDVVIGARRLSKIHSGKLRSMLSVASNLLIQMLLLPGIRDSQCGFKGFRAEAAEALFSGRQRVDGWAFDVEILLSARRAKYRIVQLNINDWHETRTGDLRDERLAGAALRSLRDVLGLRLMLWSASLARRVNYVIVTAAVGNFGLAMWIGMRQSVWFDEAYSAALIQQPIGRLIHFTSVDVHPPLYYLLLKAWAAAFGSHDFALRSFSAFVSALAVVVGLLLVRRLWSARTALITAPFAVAAPFLLRYSFEIRMYALASLPCIAATYVLVSALEATRPNRRHMLWIGYALLVAAGMYTLYYTVLVWIVHLVWCVYLTRAKRTHTKSKQPWLSQSWLFAYLAAIVLFLPWIPRFLHQLGSVQGGFWVGPATYRSVISIWSFFFSYMAEWQLTPWRSLEFMAAFISAVYFVITAFRVSSRPHKQALTLLVLYATLPVVILYAISLPPLQPVFIERYVSHTTLGASLLLGVSIATVIKRRRSLVLRGAAIGLLAVLAQGVVTLYNVGNYNFQQLHKSDARAVATYLQNHSGSHEPIIIDSPYLYLEFHHYLPNDNLKFYSAQPIRESGGDAMLHSSPLRVSSRYAFAARSVWFVYQGTAPHLTLAAHVRSRRGISISGYRAYLYIPVQKAMPIRGA